MPRFQIKHLANGKLGSEDRSTGKAEIWKFDCWGLRNHGLSKECRQTVVGLQWHVFVCFVVSQTLALKRKRSETGASSRDPSPEPPELEAECAVLDAKAEAEKVTLKEKLRKAKSNLRRWTAKAGSAASKKRSIQKYTKQVKDLEADIHRIRNQARLRCVGPSHPPPRKEPSVWIEGCPRMT